MNQLINYFDFSEFDHNDDNIDVEKWAFNVYIPLTVENDPIFHHYFIWLKEMGIPKQIVQMRMQNDGINPKYLDNPNQLSPNDIYCFDLSPQKNASYINGIQPLKQISPPPSSKNYYTTSKRALAKKMILIHQNAKCSNGLVSIKSSLTDDPLVETLYFPRNSNKVHCSFLLKHSNCCFEKKQKLKSCLNLNRVRKSIICFNCKKRFKKIRLQKKDQKIQCIRCHVVICGNCVFNGQENFKGKNYVCLTCSSTS